MFGENKNLKNSQPSSIKDISPMPAPYQAKGFGLGSYTKTNKLVTALYMVTDIIDIEEPIRHKLRSLSINMVSDINSVPSNADKKISEILSLLDIAFTVNIISEMNCSILKKEFLELKKSLNINTNSMWLEEFMGKEEIPVLEEEKSSIDSKSYSIGHQYKGHQQKISPTRIGVQKGSTLLKALSDKAISMSNIKTSQHLTGTNFLELKNKRRNEILSIIKTRPLSGTDKFEGVSIKDIMLGVRGLGEEWGEKTLQRELVSMVNDGVLNKTGLKRWSRYSIK